MIPCCCAPPLDRRAFLLALGAAALAGCAQSAAPRRALEPLQAPADRTSADIPWIDFHTHLQRRVTAEELIGQMDRTGVARMVLMALYYGDAGSAVNDGEGTDEQAADYARRFPERFVPFVGMQRGILVNRNRWLSPDDVARNLLAETDRKLASGEFFGMGEFMLRFYPYTTQLGVVAVSDMDFPADSSLMRYFADLSARYRAPMVIHCEAEPEAAEAMERLVERHPAAVVVWAHNCGRSSAPRIREMLRRYANLHADLGLMVSVGEGYGTWWPRRTPWMHLVMTPEGTVLPEMRALFEEFPDRFFVGTDRAHARAWIYHDFLARRWRLFFSQLSPPTARKLAFENVERLFRR